MRKISKFYYFVLALPVYFFVISQGVFARELTTNNELFVEVEEMIVPVVQRREVAGFFSIVLAVDCKTLEAAHKVEKYLPLIRDRFFWDLFVLLGVIWSPDFRTDITELKKRLRRRIDKTIGEDQVNDVLIISFQEHERRNANL
ncbi:MAG: flagellar basal body-associated FliL family protein [Alphaproteobacteria bacterium]|nr:flagellar basal body-associated FliL family protein [Alphaproteobacteria bacterium]NCQ66898.1 flagellar basal body-associated FliL family protein [Alphaproteobacteria bacterium]NCT07466.1 flagellar basal body-associated FliL family protein [Alphaproteobacteria bacterium]